MRSLTIPAYSETEMRFAGYSLSEAMEGYLMDELETGETPVAPIRRNRISDDNRHLW
jgi:hypothetical protein